MHHAIPGLGLPPTMISLCFISSASVALHPPGVSPAVFAHVSLVSYARIAAGGRCEWLRTHGRRTARAAALVPDGRGPSRAPSQLPNGDAEHLPRNRIETLAIGEAVESPVDPTRNLAERLRRCEVREIVQSLLQPEERRFGTPRPERPHAPAPRRDPGRADRRSVCSRKPGDLDRTATLETSAITGLCVSELFRRGWLEVRIDVARASGPRSPP